MKTIFLLLVLFLPGCVSLRSFRALEHRMERAEESNLKLSLLLRMAAQNGKENSDNLLEIAKAANGLYRHLEKAFANIFALEAGHMQTEKDLEDLNARVEGLEKKLAQLQGQLRAFKKSADPKFKQLLGDVSILRHEVKNFLGLIRRYHREKLEK